MLHGCRDGDHQHTLLAVKGARVQVCGERTRLWGLDFSVIVCVRVIVWLDEIRD